MLIRRRDFGIRASSLGGFGGCGIGNSVDWRSWALCGFERGVIFLRSL